MSITIQMPTGLSLIQTQRLGLGSFYLIDIRSPQSYQANHIPDSYNLQTQSQILQFLDEKGTAKPLLLVCFSSHKAQKMAKEIAKNTKATVHYLDCGIMELAESFHRETTSLMSSLDVSSDTSIFVTHQDSQNTELTQKTESTQSTTVSKWFCSSSMLVSFRWAAIYLSISPSLTQSRAVSRMA